MHCESFAKLNLYLRVGPRRPDGYHDLVSWFVTCGLADELSLEPADELSLTCSVAEVPVDEHNLIVRAARALQQRAGVRRGTAIHLEKRIPMGAGLGGGSSNAATALLALNRLWGLDYPVEELATLGASLGSDVPFFLYAPSAICRGRGERVEPCPAPAGKWVLLALPEIHMPTPQVYRRFDEMGLGSDLTRPPQTAGLGEPAAELMAGLFNDLEAPAVALCPRLAELRREVEEAAGRPVRMSGSGSSLFTLFDSREEAESAAAKIGRTPGVRALAVKLA